MTEGMPMVETNQARIAPDHAAAAPSDAGDEFLRPGMLQVLWCRKWVIVISTVVCLVVGYVYLLQLTPMFRSVSRLYVERKGPRIITETEGVMSESKNYLNTQCELIKSTPILESALKSSDFKTFSGAASPVAMLRRNLNAGVGVKDDIINVYFESPDADDAAAVVNAVVLSYVKYHEKKKRGTATEVLNILRKEKLRRDAELSGKRHEMLRFKRDNGTLSFESDKSNIILQRLATLAEALTTSQLSTIEAKAAYETAKAVSSDPAKLKQLIETQKDRGIYLSWWRQEESGLRGELSRLYVEISELRQEFTDDAPAIKAMKAKIAETDKQVRLWERLMEQEDDKFAQAYLAVEYQAWSTARSKEVAILESLARQQKRAEDLNVKSAEYAILMTDIERGERFCDTLDTRIKELDVSEDTEALNITIMEIAKPPSSAWKPRKPRMMAMAMLIGLMGGIGLSFFIDHKDQRLRSLREISAFIGKPVLGVVSQEISNVSLATSCLEAHLNPQSPAAEAYRGVRTAVYLGTSGRRAGTILVTSPARGDGKTVFASNLAITMAQTGQRTLLLDAQLRNPTQHTVFGSSDRSGLTSVLSDGEDVSRNIVKTGIENLDLLPAGAVPPNPSELLSSPALPEMLTELLGIYDNIVVDSPDVLSTTDARILADLCDVTVLTVRARKSTRKEAQYCRDILFRIGADILGVVVNDDASGKSPYGFVAGHDDDKADGGGLGRRAWRIWDTATARIAYRHRPMVDENIPNFQRNSPKSGCVDLHGEDLGWRKVS